MYLTTSQSGSERDRAALKGFCVDSGKVSRLKLKRDASDGLGTFEALEFLALGTQGKARALAAVGPADTRLHNMDFDRLIGRAETQ